MIYYDLLIFLLFLNHFSSHLHPNPKVPVSLNWHIVCSTCLLSLQHDQGLSQLMELSSGTVASSDSLLVNRFVKQKPTTIILHRENLDVASLSVWCSGWRDQILCLLFQCYAGRPCGFWQNMYHHCPVLVPLLCSKRFCHSGAIIRELSWIMLCFARSNYRSTPDSIHWHLQQKCHKLLWSDFTSPVDTTAMGRGGSITIERGVESIKCWLLFIEKIYWYCTCN